MATIQPTRIDVITSGFAPSIQATNWLILRLANSIRPGWARCSTVAFSRRVWLCARSENRCRVAGLLDGFGSCGVENPPFTQHLRLFPLAKLRTWGTSSFRKIRIVRWSCAPSVCTLLFAMLVDFPPHYWQGQFSVNRVYKQPLKRLGRRWFVVGQVWLRAALRPKPPAVWVNMA